MDLQTLLALIELAERAPKTKAESVWLAALVADMNKQLAAQAATVPPEPAPNGHAEPAA